MNHFFVAGIVQIETIVKVSQLPLIYKRLNSDSETIFTDVGGDAYNMSLALKWLGDEVCFVSMVGKNQNLDIIANADPDMTMATDYVLPVLDKTPTAVILYSDDAKQQIYEDIKNIRNVVYDEKIAEEKIKEADLVALSNANYCRPFLSLAQKYHKTIAINIRSLTEENRPYNEEFLKNGDIIYLSDDELDDHQDRFDYVRNLADQYDPEILLLGCGKKGVILYQKKDNTVISYKTVKTNEIVNRIGAGNALFSCFLHYYQKTGDAREAIKNAQLFASYKIGYVGTSNGFMTEEQIEQWKEMIWR